MKQATLDAMKAFAEGKRVMIVEKGSPIGGPLEAKFAVVACFRDDNEYEICTTMQVNGREYPCPETTFTGGITYYIPTPQLMCDGDKYATSFYAYSTQGQEGAEPMFSAGLCHLTSLAADAHARALFGYPDRPEPTPEAVTQAAVTAVPSHTEGYLKFAGPGEIEVVAKTIPIKADSAEVTAHDMAAIQKEEQRATDIEAAENPGFGSPATGFAP